MHPLFEGLGKCVFYHAGSAPGFGIVKNSQQPSVPPRRALTVDPALIGQHPTYHRRERRGRRRSIDKAGFVALLGCSLGVPIISIGKGNLVRFARCCSTVVDSGPIPKLRPQL
jgi:hypothetical protein